MSDALTSIGTALSSPSAKGLMAGAGAAGNIFNGVEGAIDQHRYSSAQSYLDNLITNPAAYQAAAQKYIQPLNQGLVTNVTNSTNAQLAQRGLGGSSAITQATLAQALAPYIQQNQQQGYQALQSSLGMIPGLKPQNNGGFGDISKLLATLGKPATTATTGQASLPSIFANNNNDPLGLNLQPPTGIATNPYAMGGGSMPDLSAFAAPPAPTMDASGGW